MRFRVTTLNLEQDHKRWDARRELVQVEIGCLKPDIMAFNEVCIPRQSARGLRDATPALAGYRLVQQTRVNGLSKVEGDNRKRRTRMSRLTPRRHSLGSRPEL